ncbi:MAG: YceI family protein [Bacteroidales bacterium]|nr:YceI family protein [Bacteroidales bacterium]
MKIYKIFVVLILVAGSYSVNAQKYITKEGTIEIFSETSLFTIEAINKKVASVLNAENGEVVASTLVRSFKFHEALVEEHFNENYMESHNFPKAMFKGKIANFNTVNLSKDGTYPVVIEGELTLHGETRNIKENGKLIITGGNISASTVFKISLENYKIKIEESYKDRINDEVKLTINFNYQLYNK